MGTTIEQGHQVARQADNAIIEAWAPTRAACLAEAVAGLLAVFADGSQVATTDTIAVAFPAATDDELLAAVLDEAISLVHVLGQVVVSASLSSGDSGDVAGFFEVAEVASVTLIGPIPQRVSRRDLTMDRTGATWIADVTIEC